MVEMFRKSGLTSAPIFSPKVHRIQADGSMLPT